MSKKQSYKPSEYVVLPSSTQADALVPMMQADSNMPKPSDAQVLQMDGELQQMIDQFYTLSAAIDAKVKTLTAKLQSMGMPTSGGTKTTRTPIKQTATPKDNATSTSPANVGL